jgi:protein transport protein SEC24
LIHRDYNCRLRGEDILNKFAINYLKSFFYRLDSRSMFLLDNGANIYIYVGSNVNPSWISNIFGKFFTSLNVAFQFNELCRIFAGKSSVNEIPDVCYNLPNLETPSNEALHEFINTVSEEKPFNPTIQVIRCVFSLRRHSIKSLISSINKIRDTSPCRSVFVQFFVDDRNENSLSYYEFLQHLRTQVK